ncbi:MAG TPA: DUF6118 family protein [Halothiobacillus sp.]|nr:DUF6118 family protein [Halothiobacillus sp.]
MYGRFGKIIRAEVTALRQAIEAAAERQAPDYSPDLGRITQAVNGLIDGLEAIEAHPAVRMTPDQCGQAMTRTGRELMNEVAQKYGRARQDAEREHHQLAGMIGTMRGKREQMFWLAAVFIGTFVFTVFASPVLLWELPFGWNTNAAATVMQAERWDAGSALMRVASPQGWQDLVAASALVRTNHDELDACYQATAKTGKSLRCTITIPTQ